MKRRNALTAGWLPLSWPTVAGGRKLLNGKVINSTKETNFSSYVAVGLFHYYLITLDLDFLEEDVAGG